MKIYFCTFYCISYKCKHNNTNNPIVSNPSNSHATYKLLIIFCQPFAEYFVNHILFPDLGNFINLFNPNIVEFAILNDRITVHRRNLVVINIHLTRIVSI